MAVKKTSHDTLSLADRFYVENHTEKTLEELAHDLDKPLKVIKEYCEWFVKSQTSQLIHRPAKGVVAMTEAASMSADAGYNNYNLEASIQKAASDGNYELAKELMDKKQKQDKESENVIKEKCKDYIHYIRPINGA